MNIHDTGVRKLAADEVRAFMRRHNLALADLIEIGTNMPSTTNKRIRTLAEHAWTLSHNDPVRAVEILREMTGLPFDTAFMVIDDVRPLDLDELTNQGSEEDTL
jgi:hypothetical protein